MIMKTIYYTAICVPRLTMVLRIMATDAKRIVRARKMVRYATNPRKDIRTTFPVTIGTCKGCVSFRIFVIVLFFLMLLRKEIILWLEEIVILGSTYHPRLNHLHFNILGPIVERNIIGRVIGGIHMLCQRLSIELRINQNLFWIEFDQVRDKLSNLWFIFLCISEFRYCKLKLIRCLIFFQ